MHKINYDKVSKTLIKLFNNKSLLTKIVLCLSCLIMASMGLFPPWVRRLVAYGNKLVYDKGYAFIGRPPDSAFGIASIDVHRLFIQWFVVALLTIVALALIGKVKK